MFAALELDTIESVGGEMLRRGHTPAFVFERLAVDPKEPRTLTQDPMGSIGDAGLVAGLHPPILPEAIHETRDLTLRLRGRAGPTLLQDTLPQDLGRHPRRGTGLLTAAHLTARAMQGPLKRGECDGGARLGMGGILRAGIPCKGWRKQHTGGVV